MELVAVKYMYKSLKDQSFVFVTDSVLLWMLRGNGYIESNNVMLKPPVMDERDL